MNAQASRSWSWRTLAWSWPTFGVSLACLCTTAAAPASSHPSADDAAPAQVPCGSPGQPACPMQAWMRTNLAAPLASNDPTTLAAGLDKAARMSPDAAWTSWESFANDGAAAARKGDIAGARAACRACHDAFRESYRAKFRSRPVPR